MKKLTVLLAIAMLTSQFVGCGIFRRVRDHFCRGAYCGAPAVTTPGIIAPPTVVAPQPAIVVPQASCGPCDPCVTCSPVCEPCCDPCATGGLSYPFETGYSGCSSCNSGAVVDGGVTLPSGVFPGPAN